MSSSFLLISILGTEYTGLQILLLSLTSKQDRCQIMADDYYFTSLSVEFGVMSKQIYRN